MTENAQATTRAPIRLQPEDVLFFNRQLASMARLNMPIAKGLRILAREIKDDSFRRLVEEVQHDLDEGRSLQEALSKHPETFSSLHLEIIRAGESTGNLAVILDELNSHTEAMRRVKTRVVEAITYPAVISTAIFLFVLFFLVFVAPQFEEMLVKRDALAGAVEASPGEPGLKLPTSTRVLFAVSNVVGVQVLGFPVVALGIVAAVVVLAGFGLRKVRRMGEEYDDVLLSVPLFGKLFERAALMKVTRTMRDLLLNGVSMVEALRLTGRTVGQNRIARKLDELRAAVEEGGSFSRNLAGGDVFPETMVWKLQMAEEKGIIEEALAELAQEFDLAVDQQTTLITKFLSPLLLIFMGGVVFLMFLACFVPLTNMYGG
ncbi:MAG: type II secretion system F family protein [Planctomycetes bacterium]|nr:type II secretion system F family protein [Planctomycetota bacterium]